MISVKFRYLFLSGLYLFLAVYDGKCTVHIRDVLLNPLQGIQLRVCS